MTIYIDGDYRCHTTAGEGRTAAETDAFEGKRAAYIEGFRLVPEGQSWTRDDGAVFEGLMISPAESYGMLRRFQEQYEADEAEHMAEVAALVELIYEADLEVIG